MFEDGEEEEGVEDAKGEPGEELKRSVTGGEVATEGGEGGPAAHDAEEGVMPGVEVSGAKLEEEEGGEVGHSTHMTAGESAGVGTTATVPHVAVKGAREASSESGKVTQRELFDDTGGEDTTKVRGEEEEREGGALKSGEEEEGDVDIDLRGGHGVEGEVDGEGMEETHCSGAGCVGGTYERGEKNKNVRMIVGECVRGRGEKENKNKIG